MAQCSLRGLTVSAAMVSFIMLAPLTIQAKDETSGSMADGPISGVLHDHEMRQAMQRMNQDMMKANTGDPDKDFAFMMMPHHRAAVDMAKSYLTKGKDAKFREMAEKIIKSQEKEIKEMQAHLAELEQKGSSTPGSKHEKSTD